MLSPERQGKYGPLRMANQKITYLDTDLKSFRTIGDLFFFTITQLKTDSQSVCLYLSVSVCLPVYLSLSVYMRVCPTVSSVCLFVSVYLLMPVCKSVSVYLSVILTVFRNRRRDRNSGRQIS